MKFSGPQAKDRFKRMMADRACAINQIMPRQFTVQEVTKALTNGFIDEWQINAVPDKLTKEKPAYRRTNEQGQRKGRI